MLENLKKKSWTEDQLLRVECYDETIDCCDKVEVVSLGSAQFYYPKLLGIYDFWDAMNGRSVYKHQILDYYLFYNDWGTQLVR